MLLGFLLLLLCQLAGEIVVIWLQVSVPGSVVGMVMLLGLLIMLQEVPAGLRLAGEGLLKVLPLLLVPAGVGLMRHFGILADSGMQLLLILFISTLITMLAVVFCLKFFSGKGVEERKS